MSEALLAMLLIFGSHETGHTLEAQSPEITRSCDFIVCTATGDHAALTRMASAGFTHEDIMVTAQGGRTIAFVAAAHKITYVAVRREDLRMIQELQGETTAAVASAALLASALDDLRPGPRSWDARYWMSRCGAPGIQISWRF